MWQRGQWRRRRSVGGNGGRAAAVEKNGFCVFSILMSKKEAVCPDGRIIPAVFRVSGFHCATVICRSRKKVLTYYSLQFNRFEGKI
jgi:hypothetical protein